MYCKHEICIAESLIKVVENMVNQILFEKKIVCFKLLILTGNDGKVIPNSVL